MESLNAAAYFVDRHLEEGRAGATAIECGDRRISYGELHEQVNRVGTALRERLGVRPEERVLLLMLDSPEMIYSFFGAIKIGAVPVPINTLWTPADYEFVLHDARPRVVIVTDSLRPRIVDAVRRCPWVRHLVVFGEAGDGEIGFDELVGSGLRELEAESTSADAPAFWLYSSGSTGSPKGCVHLQHDMLVCANNYARGVLGIASQDRCFSVAKLFFAYGLGNAMYFPLAVGATSILWPGAVTPPVVYDLIERYRPTLFYSVPTHFAMMLAHHREGRDFDLSSIRSAVSAGEALPPVVHTRFRERFGVEILDGIGSTEVLHIFISNRPGQSRAGSSGQLVPGYDAQIVDEQGAAVPPGATGQLLIRGDSTCAYYWNRHEKTKETIVGHWIRTGRSLPAGRGRLLLVRRPLRRHAESGRPLGQPGRARTDARRASGRERLRSCRPRGSRRSHQADRLRRRARRRTGDAGTGSGAAAVRARAAGRVQTAAVGGVRARRYR